MTKTNTYDQENRLVKSYEPMERLIRALKYCSDERHQVTAVDLSSLRGLGMSQKKIRSYLEYYLKLQDTPVGAMLVFHNRGRLACSGGRKRDERYYWKELLTEEERTFLKKALTSQTL